MKNDFNKATEFPSPKSLKDTFRFADIAGHGALPGAEEALSVETAAPSVSKKPDFQP